MNKKVIILKGLPASGKSSLAMQYKETGYNIFSRDQARIDNPHLKESGIAEMEKQFILMGYDKIILDSTHMWKPSLEKIKMFCQGNGYKIEIVDMIDHIPARNYLDVCLTRNRKREGAKRVPDSVIYQMYLQNYDLRSYKSGYVIVDIDGTIADISHRLHYLEETPKNHDAFYDEVDKDTPIEKVIDIVRYLSEEHFIILTSGRRNQCCDKTVAWLKKYKVPYDALLMRQSWDRRPDTEVKKEIYEKCLKGKNIVMSIDDRPSIVALWRSFGIFTVDVNQRGDF